MSAWKRLGFWLLEKQKPMAINSAITFSLVLGAIATAGLFGTYGIQRLRGQHDPVVLSNSTGFISSRTLEDENELKKAFKLREED